MTRTERQAAARRRGRRPFTPHGAFLTAAPDPAAALRRTDAARVRGARRPIVTHAIDCNLGADCLCGQGTDAEFEQEVHGVPRRPR